MAFPVDSDGKLIPGGPHTYPEMAAAGLWTTPSCLLYTSLNTRMGNDHYRFVSTDFIPAPEFVKGVGLGSWTPIYTMSGPIRKGKMWFIDALDGEYDNNITKQLPSGADSDHVWRMNNLAKLQSNLTTRNIVTASFLSDHYHDQYAGLGVLQPQPTTPTEVETAYLGSLKDLSLIHI